MKIIKRRNEDKYEFVNVLGGGGGTHKISNSMNIRLDTYLMTTIVLTGVNSTDIARVILDNMLEDLLGDEYIRL